MLSRNAAILLILAVAPFASGEDTLAALREKADKTSATWEALAKGLETKIARLLPCDPSSRAAVEEVTRASDARLLAQSAYLKAAATQAKSDTDAAKRVLAAQAALAGGWNTERAEADQERTAIEALVADLKESMRKRGALVEAEKVLVELAKMVNDRSVKSEEQASGGGTITGMIGDLVIAYQDRQTAFQNEVALLDAESVKWTSYYTARLARAATECSITNPGFTRKKQP